jgi:cobalt/nickel transport system permease protein
VPAAQLVFLTHLPLMAVEAVLTGTIVVFLQRVKPEVLILPSQLPAEQPGRA